MKTDYIELYTDYFCEYLQEIDLKNSKTIPTIVEIKHLYLNDKIISDKEKIER